VCIEETCSRLTRVCMCAHQAYDAKGIEAIGNLPSKQELYAQVRDACMYASPRFIGGRWSACSPVSACQHTCAVATMASCSRRDR
jgi:hypothetical protein